ncbi:Uncharacterized protein PBTT_01421 [Plasmodiophora brassicae]|uniref:Uncharacterized protein n=1 Tax=Plasmodiophora brassicae TaxID=37360 RepID=A0A0G4IIC5_PLABS|nr:hypothetical protein PBRA_003643 [Plasmodiophora brassicae]
MRLCQAVGRLLTTGAAVRSQTASTAPTTEELIKQLVDVTQTRFRYEVARDQAIMSGLLVYVVGMTSVSGYILWKSPFGQQLRRSQEQPGVA